MGNDVRGREKEEAETFSIEGILVSCPTDTFFLPLKLPDPEMRSKI